MKEIILKKDATLSELIKQVEAGNPVFVKGFGRFNFVVKKFYGNFPQLKAEFIAKKVIFHPTETLRDRINNRVKSLTKPSQL